MFIVEEIKSGIFTKNGRTYVCSCGSEALVFEFPKTKDKDDFCTVAIWEMYNVNNSIWQRLRHCWRILKYGHPYTDMVCLNKSQVKKLNKYIQKELQ